MRPRAEQCCRFLMPLQSLVPASSLTIATGTLIMEAADGISPWGLHTSPNHTVHLLFHLWVSSLHSPKVQVAGIVSLHLGNIWHGLAQGGWELLYPTHTRGLEISKIITW